MKLDRRRVLASLALAPALNLLAACSRQESERVLLLLKTLDNPFFRDIDAGFRSKWSSMMALDVRAGKNEADVPGQRVILESYLRANVRGRNKPILRGLVLTPSDSGDGLVPLLAEFRRAGIPLVLVDTAISPEALKAAGTDYNVLLASDNLLGGRLAAKLVLDAMAGKKQANVLILNGVPESDTAKQRREGFLGVVQGSGFDLRERTGNWRRSEARTIVESFRIAGQISDAIFAANDEMAIGAIEALRQSKAALPYIVGFDATDEARLLVKQEILNATIAQSPKHMGERAAEVLADLVAGKASYVMRAEPVAVEVVTKANA